VTKDKKAAPILIRDSIRQSILTGEYHDGDPLRQDELATKFGTSRIPVREALRQLESEGLIVLQPNKGAVVKGISIDEVIELLDIRIALECRALELSIPNMALEDFEQARSILEEYDASEDPASWGEMNWLFHCALYAPCNKVRLLSMIEENYGHVSRFTRSQVSMASGKKMPQKEHFELLRLCEASEVDKAVQLLRKHIEQAMKSLLANNRKKLN